MKVEKENQTGSTAENAEVIRTGQTLMPGSTSGTGMTNKQPGLDVKFFLMMGADIVIVFGIWIYQKARKKQCE